MSFPAGHALLVGVRTFQHLTLRDDSSAADVEEVSSILQDPALCGYPPTQVTVLTDAAATRAGVLGALHQLSLEVTAEDVVLVLFCGYSGAGADGHFTLVTHDTQAEQNKLRAETGISMPELALALQSIESQHVVLMFDTVGFPGDSAAALVATGIGRTIIAASRETQYSWVIKGSSLFIQALRDGLQGQGVSNRNGYIGVYDLYAYLFDAVTTAAKQQVGAATLQQYGNGQESVLTVQSGDQPFAIARYRGAQTTTPFQAPDRLPSGTAAVAIEPAAAHAALDSMLRNSRYAPRDALPADGPVPAFDVQGTPGASHQTNGGVEHQWGDLQSHSVNTAGGKYVVGTDQSRGIVGGTFGGPAVGVVEGGTVIGTHHGDLFLGTAERLSIPQQIPLELLLSHYVDRQTHETELRTALLADTAHAPLIVLWGMSGTGKSVLAAKVIEQLQQERSFPGGILWGDLEQGSPDQVLTDFVGTLERGWQRSAEQKASGQRLWQILGDRRIGSDHNGAGSLRTLLVLDGVTNEQQIEAFLPTARTGCRVLIISTTPLDGQNLAVGQRCRIGPFDEAQTLLLFRKLLDAALVETQLSVFSEIGQELDQLPEQVTWGARLLQAQATKLSPAVLLRRLQEGEQRRTGMGGQLATLPNLALQDLTDDQAELFELIGVLGDGDWSAEMLAAVALQPVATVKQVLQVLERRDLLTTTGNRYRVKRVVRDAARERLATRTSYDQQAAYHLLARFCLDLAQDLEAALQARPSAAAQTGTLDADEQFFGAFQSGLFPEINHIRHVLAWATEQGCWEIIGRFAYLPYMELVHRLVAAIPATRMELNMATVRGMILRWQRPEQGYSVKTLLSTAGVVRLASDTVIATSTNAQVWQANLSLPKETGLCEVQATINAGHIVDGILSGIEFVDTTWTGVRANNHIFQSCDMVGVRLLACDLSHSVWVDCDARRAVLIGSNLSHALLKRIKLRGANLQGVNLSGAILEEVDLRGADLRGTNLSGVRMQQLNLLGAQVDDVIWAGAQGQVMIEEALLPDITKAAALPPALANESPYTTRMETTKLANVVWTDNVLHKADLRTVEMTKATLNKVRFDAADLRAAVLMNVTACEVALSHANLSAANLTNVVLDKVDLHEANLRAASFNNVTLRDCDLREAKLDAASLRSATISGGDWTQACLTDADLSGATLDGVTLKKSNLNNALFKDAQLQATQLDAASLEMADFCNARLAKCELRGARLDNANFAGTVMGDSKLDDATCPNTNFRGATITDEQLARIRRLGGATLPNGTKVPELAGTYTNDQIGSDLILRFAELLGTFSQINLSNRDLLGAYLEGSFRGVDFSQSNLRNAILVGTFSDIKFTATELAAAKFQGTFVGSDFTGAKLAHAEFRDSDCGEANFTRANLQRAILSDSNFAGCDFTNALLEDAQLLRANLRDANFTGATGLRDRQWKQVRRLRGATMPDGSRYDGKYALVGDLEDAVTEKVALENEQERRRFYLGVGD